MCRRFLAYLSLDEKSTTGIVAPGFHNTITKCTLPEWTPESFVDDMNETFGLLLRTELVNLSREAAVQGQARKRRESSGSGVSIGTTGLEVGKLV